MRERDKALLVAADLMEDIGSELAGHFRAMATPGSFEGARILDFMARLRNEEAMGLNEGEDRRAIMDSVMDEYFTADVQVVDDAQIIDAGDGFYWVNGWLYVGVNLD